MNYTYCCFSIKKTIDINEELYNKQNKIKPVLIVEHSLENQLQIVEGIAETITEQKNEELFVEDNLEDINVNIN